MNRIQRFLSVACVAVMSGATPVHAEVGSPSFGTSNVQADVISAWEMEAGSGTTTWSIAPNGYRYVTGGDQTLMAVVHAPQGSLLTALDLEACDSAPSGDVSAMLYRNNASGNTNLANTQTTGVPGCGRFRVDFAIPEQVDNESYTYVAFVSSGNTTGLVSIGALRCYFKLQVSPAPPAATFNDVPTSDPGFQYIEALVASGITAGCGGGNYCPDSTLTRRQMAVFLSKALGLNWLSPTPPNLAP